MEDSFKCAPGPDAARRVIKVLAPDLLARLAEEHEVRVRGTRMTISPIEFPPCLVHRERVFWVFWM